MSEAEKAVRREERVEKAKRYLINLQNRIEILKLNIETMPKFDGNSNLPNTERTIAGQELGQLEKELNKNYNAVEEATVEDDDVKAILDNIQI